jgi:hypothetical protein
MTVPSHEGEFRGTARFRVVRCLGEGGMGVVYEVEDRESARRLALKTVRGSGGEELVVAADAWMAEQGIRNPGRWAAMVAPGFDADGRAAS